MRMWAMRVHAVALSIVASKCEGAFHVRVEGDWNNDLMTQVLPPKMKVI